jgi:hypothetical protein
MEYDFIMIISIHQPNYFPYYGYFNKIKYSDVFVFLDNVTFSKNSYINRNKIKTSDGVKWLTVPIINDNILNTKIKDVNIFGSVWKHKHIKTIEYNYSKSINFCSVYDILTDIYKKDWKNLSDLNTYIISNICNLLEMKPNFVWASKLDVSGKSTHLLADICEELKADTYLSGSSGKNYIEDKIFSENNIKVIYQKFKHPVYNQRYGNFVENLSILDMLFNTDVVL